ncbi:protease pro-enzyme activation domain-containing protein [Granulicella cerasi]|uniref:Protease pro-enzyme activation domain-containing protein n=1 Tax=Granulicella cerasi TaxID=741063 RepID=A0ABW1Z4I6_9BACT|nr:protease pro-enzyme activation domain-containing protein [Granulicella cerasi]
MATQVIGAPMRYLAMATAMLGAVLPVAAQTVPQARVGAIDNSQRVAVQAASPRLRSAQVTGAAASDRVLPHMTLRFSMTDAQTSALKQLLANQQNPASAQYHQWLSPEAFASQFGAAPTDLAKAQAWLKSQGFTVTKSARGGQFISFSGTVSQAEAAFGTTISQVKTRGVSHIANTSAVSLPTALAAAVSSVGGLDDFVAQPRRAFGAPQDVLKPQYTAAGTHYLAPGDLYTIYDVSGLISAGTNGSGVTIAVVGQTEIYPADIAAFRTAAGLTANAATVQLYGVDPGYSSTSDVNESESDIEWAGAMAPSATILFVTATDVLNGSITEAIDNNLAPIIANSYGTCEADLGVSQLAYYNQLLQQGAAEGITIVSPAGDSGAADCDAGVTTAQYGLAVDFPGSSPYVTAVGGTELNEGSGSYWSSSNGSAAGSLVSYVPEVVWNDTANGSTLSAGGGGTSAYFSKPSWQAGTIFGVTVSADGTRDVPDLSLAASGSHDPYVFCNQGACTNGFLNASGTPTVTGGTSIASPVFAGMMALVVQKQGRVGVANNQLYALAASSYASGVFHDITSGTNAVPCTTGTTNCASGGTIGYTAATGYDLASGIGSVDAGNLVNDWSLVTPTATATAGTASSRVDVAGSASTVAAGTSITLTATVSSVFSSTTATPTGTMQFVVDGAVVGTGSLSNGIATYTLATAGFTSGTHLVQASYGGDATYAGSVGAFSITVTAASTSGFSLTPTKSTINVSSGATSQGVVLTVTPANGFTGTVNFTLSSSSTFAGQLVLSSTSVNITGTAPVSTTLTVLAYTGGLAQSKLASFSTLYGMGALTLLLLPFAMRGRGRVRWVSCAMLAACFAASMTGCTSGATTPTSIASKTTPTPTGTYSITVSATGTVNGTSVTRNSTVSVVVQ